MRAAYASREPVQINDLGLSAYFERRADGVHVYMTAIRSHFTPDIVRVKEIAPMSKTKNWSVVEIVSRAAE